jgi:hypothetical protein
MPIPFENFPLCRAASALPAGIFSLGRIRHSGRSADIKNKTNN